MALRLRRRGIDRVRPLAGGYDAWRAAGFPMETLDAAVLPTSEVQATDEER